ncbi:MAG: AraC family transcriptional regulator [Defluviitaleaceae bacterium]|nr:AraC family transcriptional regulator [Defluviitaleaceae bacterium]
MQSTQEILEWRREMDISTRAKKDAISDFVKKRNQIGKGAWVSEAGADFIAGAIEDLNAEINAANAFKDQIDAIIDKVDDPRARVVLQLRYSRGLIWPDVAEAAGFDQSYVHRLHRKALGMLDNIRQTL